MTDANLRDLERRFRASGSVEDEAAYLRARVQAGELEQSRLELAAHCGDPAASIALPTRAASEGLRAWTAGLRSQGQAVATRAAVACGHVAYPAWAGVEESVVGLRWTKDQRAAALAAIQAAEHWVQCPCDRHAEAARVAGHLVSRWPSPECCFEFVAGTAWTKNPATSGWFPTAVSTACMLTSEDQVRAAVQAELVPWALGYSDPVWSRVTKRGIIELKPDDSCEG